MAGDYIDPRLYSKMTANEPYASYKKTMISKLVVTVLSPFNELPEGIMLEGDPKKDETAWIDVWNEKQDVYFKNANRKLFEMGLILKFDKKPHVDVKTIAQFNDAELSAIISKPYTGFTKEVAKIELMAVASRLLDLAREQEKSERYIEVITAKLSELQLKELGGTEKEE